ncbi:tripartite tricarboxylate transporter permease [Rubrobacter xylanophilus]|uniref:tripartite tricarboxylate transporter permease n=1 Tax=Rubrobacter xylanophilus TaxID=49319 RepID=UPI001C643A4E|nr:tripartite tricarboxylate transporter permease [Rubrobacter xylanophilus]
MEVLEGLTGAFVSVGPGIVGLVFVGVIVGLVVGVLPGLSFVMGVLLLVPLTYGMDARGAVALLLALYVAGTYGGALTSILLRVPGESNDVVLLWDGNGMARRGRAAEALGWAACSAFVGGLASWLLLVVASRPFASVALSLSSSEYFLIVLLGLSTVLVLSETSVSAALLSMLVGMLVSTVGVSSVSGTVRYDFGVEALRSGVDYLTVMIGVYALAEVMVRFTGWDDDRVSQRMAGVRTALPGLRDLIERYGSFVRGVLAGSFVGTVPGAGATIASFVAYGLERQFGRFRHEVGRASPSGIIAPQTASTATVGGALIPLLALGIPGSAATAVLLGVLQLHDVQPGPQVFSEQPQLVYTVFAAFLISLLGMFLIGVLCAGPLVYILRVPEVYVLAFIVVFSYIGAFAIRQSMSDVWVMFAFGVAGFLMHRGEYPVAPLVLGAILGPLAERHFLTAMISSGNDPTVFLTRPVSAGLLALLAAVVCWAVYRAVSGRRWDRTTTEGGV